MNLEQIHILGKEKFMHKYYNETLPTTFENYFHLISYSQSYNLKGRRNETRYLWFQATWPETSQAIMMSSAPYRRLENWLPYKFAYRARMQTLHVVCGCAFKGQISLKPKVKVKADDCNTGTTGMAYHNNVNNGLPTI